MTSDFVGPGEAVAVPPAIPPVYSLYSLARKPNDPDDRWAMGLAYRPEPCDNTGTYDPCDRAVKRGGDADDTRPDAVTFQPFGVYAHASCFTFSMERVRGLRDEATRNLLARRHKQIEHEFWEGTFAQAKGYNNAYLRRAGASVLTLAAGASPAAALACLEQAIADGKGERGMIHCTPQVFSMWARDYLVETDGRSAFTHLGTIVVPGVGYTGSAPAGTTDASGVSWAYATDMVDVRVTDPVVRPDTLVEATSRTTNEVIYRAEQEVAVTFDGCVRAAAGVQVTGCLAIPFGS